MKSSVSNIKLTSVDELFKTDETRADEMPLRLDFPLRLSPYIPAGK